MLAVAGCDKASFQVSLPLAGLPARLRAYLPLFARLLSSSTGLIVPRCLAASLGQSLGLPAAAAPTEMPFVYLNNEQIDKAFADAFDEHSAFVGEHAARNSTGHWPVEVLTLSAQIPADGLQRAFALFALKLLFGDFGVDAVCRTAASEGKRLLALKGTPSSLLIDSFQWLRTPGSLDARTVGAADSGKISRGAVKIDEPLGRALNIYHQTAFMSSVAAALDAAIAGDAPAAAQTARISDSIMRIRAHFAHCVLSSGVIHVAWPQPVTSDSAKTALNALVSDWCVFAEIWRQNHRLAVAIPDSPPPDPAPPRKKRRAAFDSASKHTAQAVPPGKRLGSRDFVRLAEPLGIHFALPSLHTSYVGIQMPLDICCYPSDTPPMPFASQLQSLPALDFYSLSILTTLLSRSEGAMKNAIRSRGYAYGLGIHPRCKDGHLAIYIGHATDPKKALDAVWEITELLASESGWQETIDDFQINSAKSTFLFRTYCDLPRSIASEDAYALFCGFLGIDQALLWMRKHVEAVTVASMRRAFIRYLLPLVRFDDSVSKLYIVATPASYAQPAAEFVAALNDNPYGVRFKPMPFSALDPTISI
ncbi:hypothetical protein FB639_004605 [Coemansia asiatica]|nr:hypothetical protein FB639_004605 [Coemansia asiatica]